MRSRSTVGDRTSGPGARRRGAPADTLRRELSHELRRPRNNTTTTTTSTTSTPIRRPRRIVGDAETLLRRAVDIVATAPTMPLSSSPRIDRDEISNCSKNRFTGCPTNPSGPMDAQGAPGIRRQDRREADELLEAARVRAERMVQRTEVVRAAEQRACQVMETAEADSRRLKARDAGLPRSAPRLVRDPARQAAEDGARRPTAAVDRGDPRRDGRDRRGGPDHGVLRPGRLKPARHSCRR